MERNLILAGVGGQGILTIAQILSRAALRRGWFVKQAEVHGMSQRGGAVYSHLRIADHELHSDLIPKGRAGVIVAMEPLEGLRYVNFLRPGGCILSNTSPLENIPNYPPTEEVLSRVFAWGDHVLIDASRLAKAAGSALAANTALTGAASVELDFDAGELEQAIRDQFHTKGERAVTANVRAFFVGRSACLAYREGFRRGTPPVDLRIWATTVPVEALESAESPDRFWAQAPDRDGRMQSAEYSGVLDILQVARRENREQLFEHEVYRLVEAAGAITPPRHLFVPAGETVTPEQMGEFPGSRVVLKVVSPDIVHKSEVGAVAFVDSSWETVNAEISRMSEEFSRRRSNVVGVLVVEFVEGARGGFGGELFVGIRASREFGAVIAAGLGGVDTEYLARRLRPGAANVKALALETSPGEFFAQFRETAAYDILSEKARGHIRIASDAELKRCFRAFIAVARRFCVPMEGDAPRLVELEVNPFSFVRQKMVPLDGRGRLGTVPPIPPARPLKNVVRLLEPKSMAIVGASAQRVNFGRIILRNTLAAGFPPDQLLVLRSDIATLDGVRCIASMEDAPGPIDLLVVASASEGVPALINSVLASGRVSSVILIPGGLGETSSTRDTHDELQSRIREARKISGDGPVVLGANCLGVRSRPGCYDTFFIPDEKLDPRRGDPTTRTALITQSGGFAITRMANLESINPALAITIGNQMDLTGADVFQAVSTRDDIDVVGVYMEGFTDGDGTSFVRSVEWATASGKVVVFYKAGRTAQGRSATQGHTASIAGDFEVCQSVVAAAGAIVVDTFKEFEQLVELATLFHGKKVGGRRIGVISNAGFEAVGMADSIQGARYQLEMAELGKGSRERIRETLSTHGLDALVEPKNPLDLNPMANEEVYEDSIHAMLDDPNVDAVVASVVPFTPELQTTAEELSKSDHSLVDRLGALARIVDKPLLMVIDAGRSYDELARRLRRRGVPVLPTCDQAVRSMGRYLCHRSARAGGTNEAIAAAELPRELAKV